MNMPPKGYVWFFLGPSLYLFLIGTTQEVRGVDWVVANRQQPIAEVWRDAEVVVRSPQEWLAEAATPSDLLVMPGGRNGALGTARLTKAATALGCSMAIVADRASVSASDRAAEGLGLVTSRTARA
jgi:hypothetical protein